MGTLHVLTLLLSAVLFCSAAPALGPVTCSEGNGSVTADVALHHINEQHDHGYKFRLQQVQGNRVKQVDRGCNVELQLELRETKCHIINPTPFKDCPLRDMHEQAVMANCTVFMTVKDGEASVTKYECDTKRVKMTPSCPDCPSLMALNSTEGLKSVNEGVKEFNKNTSNQHYYILKEVGRIKAGHMMTAGMNFYSEFALVETRCPMGSRIVPEACKPLCPDRARHAFCRSTYSTQNGLQSVKCDVYPALNSTVPGPGEEPLCKHRGRPHSHGHGRPPHAGSGGPPPQVHDKGQGRPPQAGSGGPPPQVHDKGQGRPPQAGSGGPPPQAHGQGQGRPPQAGSGGPPPQAHGQGQGRPPQAGSGGPPPQAHGQGQGRPPQAGSGGPPPHARDHGHGPPPHAGPSPHGRRGPCNGFVANPDPALHPICPWPLTRPKNTQS